MAKSVFEQLVRSGKVVRGWIGVTIQDLTPELAESFGLRNTSGALVSDILKGSPADKAGIRKGDIILAFDGKDIQNVSVLRNTVAQGRIGSKAEIKVVRNKNVKQFQVAVVEYPREYSIESMPEISTEPVRKEVLGGITVIQLTKDFARQLGVSAEDRGVVIVHVEPGSPAEDAGLREGDVIQEIDRQPVQSLKDFNTLASAVKNNATIILYINRNGRKSYFTLRAL